MLNHIEAIDLKEKVHFIGVGGSSMNGLAEILSNMGYTVSGSDMRLTKVTDKLEKKGIKVYEGHNAENIIGKDVIIYTAAISEENPELKGARENSLKIISRAKLLGYIMNNFSKSIAVSGTHGKTSTTSMIASILLVADTNPTIHLGGCLDSIGGSTNVGDSDFFVTEACEYHDSFLNFYPKVAVILNLELDHVDYFRDIEQMKTSFKKFINNVPKDGFVVAHKDDKNIQDILVNTDKNIITYSMTNSCANWHAADIEYNDNGTLTYMLYNNKSYITDIELPVFGNHNILNSLAAIASCHALGCDIEKIKEGLKRYQKPQRRFEIKGYWGDVKVVDDYAHHPTEVKTTLEAARKMCKNKVWCVFQPHTYTRTKNFINEFSESFGLADKVIVTDIYAAREKDKNEIHAKDLMEKIKEKGKDVEYISSFEEISIHLDANVEQGDILIVMGAGDVNTICEIYLEIKENK